MISSQEGCLIILWNKIIILWRVILRILLSLYCCCLSSLLCGSVPSKVISPAGLNWLFLLLLFYNLICEVTNSIFFILQIWWFLLVYRFIYWPYTLPIGCKMCMLDTTTVLTVGVSTSKIGASKALGVLLESLWNILRLEFLHLQWWYTRDNCFFLISFIIVFLLFKLLLWRCLW